MAQRQHYYGENLGQSTTTTTDFSAVKVSLTFTPDASSVYYIIWSAILGHSAINSDCRCRLQDITNAATFATFNIELKDNTDKEVCCGVHKFTAGASPVATTFQIQFAAEAGTANIQYAKLFVVKHAIGDEYTETIADSTTTSGAYLTQTTLSFTPAAQKDHLVFYTGQMRVETSAVADFCRMIVDDTTVYHESNRSAQDVTSYVPWGGFAKVNFTAAAHTIKTQWRNSGGVQTVHLRNSAVLVLDATKFANIYYAENLGPGSTTSATYVDRLTVTEIPVARKHLIVGSNIADVNSTSLSVGRRILDSTTPETYSEELKEHVSTTDFMPSGLNVIVRDLAASFKAWKMQWNSEGAATATLDDATLAIVDLDDGVTVSTHDINAAGIVSAEAFGQPIVQVLAGSKKRAKYESLIFRKEADARYRIAQQILLAKRREVYAELIGPHAINAVAIASAEAFGQPLLLVEASDIVAASIPSAEALGQPSLNVAIAATAIVSAEALGQPAVLAGATNIIAAGIASAEAIGTPSLVSSIDSASIPGAESFGLPVIPEGIPAPSGPIKRAKYGSTFRDQHDARYRIAQQVLLSKRKNVFVVGVAAQNIIGTGNIASAEAFGQPAVSLVVASTGIASAETFGASALSATVNALSIPTAEAVGAPLVSITAGIVAAGIPSAEALGQPAIRATVSAAGIASAEAFGTHALSADLSAAGIASVGAIGIPTVSPDITAVGIATAEAFGQPILEATVSSAGIASAENFGQPTVQPQTTIVVAGVASAEAFGTPELTAQVNALGIASAEALGLPVVGLISGIVSSGIASAEAFGQPTLQAQIAATGVVSAEALGTPALQSAIVATGIASSEALGQPDVSANVAATGIASAEAVGQPSVDASVAAIGIASAEIVGSPIVRPNIAATGIASGEAFGIPTLLTRIVASGIASAEAIGQPVISTDVLAAGIASAEAVGIPIVGPAITAVGIASAEAVSNVTASADIAANGIASEEDLGLPVVGLVSGIVSSGVPSAEAFGAPTLQAEVAQAGIVSAEAFGQPNVSVPWNITGSGAIPSGETFGAPVHAIVIGAIGIGSAEALGQPTIQALGDWDIVGAGTIVSLEAFGLPIIGEPVAERLIGFESIDQPWKRRKPKRRQEERLRAIARKAVKAADAAEEKQYPGFGEALEEIEELRQRFMRAYLSAVGPEARTIDAAAAWDAALLTELQKKNEDDDEDAIILLLADIGSFGSSGRRL